jgi:hypothetical protein
MSIARISNLRRTICALSTVLLLTAVQVHAATVSAAVPDDATARPDTPSSLALLSTGLVFLLIIRRRYRLR